jgi:hypothetical protein
LDSVATIRSPSGRIADTDAPACTVTSRFSISPLQQPAAAFVDLHRHQSWRKFHDVR